MNTKWPKRNLYKEYIYIYIEREKGNNEGGGLPQMVIASKWQEPLPYLYIRTRYKSAENRFKSLYGWSTRTKNKNLEDTRQKKNTNNKDDSPTGEGHKSVSVVGTREKSCDFLGAEKNQLLTSKKMKVDKKGRREEKLEESLVVDQVIILVVILEVSAKT